jgi:serine/threonine protein kinase/flagellar biosynthesis GTPase FlhF
VRFQCIHCQGILAVDDFQPGEAVACGHCGNAVAVPESRVAAGALVGDFVIRKLLGEGGMGAVYLAHQVSLDRDAAVKVLHERYSSDDAYIQDFIREARAAAALNHASIVQAYAVGDDEGLFYFAMEYVEGSTLLHGGRMVVDRALAIGIEVAEALDFGWRKQGLVHRDIKPDNIILTSGGHAKLADLGLARKVNDLTEEGTRELYGTPQYISPEQLLGSAGDNRSDIYSLGATLYHALTGRFPYTGSTPTEIAQKHLTDVLQPMRSLLPDIPENVARVVETALAKRPAHRYKDTAAFLADLKRVRDGESPACQSAPGAQRPIDLDAGDADLLVPETMEEDSGDGEPKTGSKKLSIVRKEVRKHTPTIPSKDPTESGLRAAVALPSDTNTSGAIPPEPDSGSDGAKRAIWIVAALLVVAALGAGSFFAHRYFLTADGADEHAGATASAGSETAGEAAAALDDIQAMISDAGPESEIVDALEAYANRFGTDTGPTERFFTMAAPYVEADLDTSREALHKTEIAAWENRRNELEQERRRALEEEEKRKQQAEEERRQQEEERRKNEQREAYLQEMAEKQQTLREESVKLCLAHDYSGAALLFAGMLSSREPEFRQWAATKQACINNAAKLYELISNTDELLAGTPIPIPNDKRDWEVTDIGYTAVELKSRVLRYERGEAREEIREMKLPLDKIRAVQMYRLAEARWTKNPVPEEPLPLLFGCYLLSRAEYLDEARKQLQSAGPEGEVFLDDIENIAPIARLQEFLRYFEQMKTFAASDNASKTRLRAMAAALEKRFPDEYSKYRDDIDTILGGE